MLEVDFTTFQSLNMAIASGICVFAIIFMFGKLLFTCPRLDERLVQLGQQYGQINSEYLKASLNQQLMGNKKRKKKNDSPFSKRLVDTFLKNPFLAEENMKTSFEQAGWNSKETQFYFLASKFLFLLGGLTIGYILIEARASFHEASMIIKGLILTLTTLSGWLLPDLYLKGVIRKRVELIEKQFPDALDLIIICLQAGLGLNRAIERVAKEMVMFGKEIAQELMLTNIELEIMLDRRQALQNLYTRVPSQMIRTFSTSVLQSIQQGTPTLQTLDVLSKEIRDSRMQRAETKAAKLPSLMVIPLVLFVLPNLFIVLLGPAIVRILNVT